MSSAVPTDTSPTDVQDVIGWKTKSEAAALLGVSEKAIERAAARQEIRAGWRREALRKPYRVYCPEDLEKKRATIPRQVHGEIVPDAIGRRL
jgi:hypothetical protein